MSTTILVTCPNQECRKRYNIPEGKKRYKCKSCGTELSKVYKKPGLEQHPPKPLEIPHESSKNQEKPIDSKLSVFISHSSKNKVFVDGLKRFLEDNGLAVWVSRHDIQSNQEYDEIILENLEKAHFVVAVLSKTAESSPWINKEIDLTLSQKPNHLFSIKIEECNIKEIHPELVNRHYEEFDKEPDFSKRKLLGSFFRQLNKDRVDQVELVKNLKIEKTELKAQKEQNQKEADEREQQIQNALKFDGYWGGQSWNASPFKPINKRLTPIISVFNLKGGVGKTTLTANLGATIWGPQMEQRVLLIDLDYQGSLSRICLGSEKIESLREQSRLCSRIFAPKRMEDRILGLLMESILDLKCPKSKGKIVASDENLYSLEVQSLIHWLLRRSEDDVRYRLRNILHTFNLNEQFDYVLIDCPPKMSTGAINALLASDYVLIPTIMDGTSVESIPRLLTVLKSQEKLFSHLKVLGVVVNCLKQTTGPTDREGEELKALPRKLKDVWGEQVKIFKNHLHLFPENTRFSSIPFPAHHSLLKKKFVDLWNEIREEMDLGER